MAIRRVTQSRASAVIKSPSIKSDRFSDLCPPDVLKTLTDMEIQRQETIYELIKTEKQYVADMELVIKVSHLLLALFHAISSSFETNLVLEH